MPKCQPKGLARFAKNMKFSVLVSGADDLGTHRFQSVELKTKDLSKRIRNSTTPKIPRVDQSSHSMLINLGRSVATIL